MLMLSRMVCRRDLIAGFEVEREEARALLSNDTTDICDSQIYITTNGEYIYAQTNYISPGHEHPAKLITKERVDLRVLALNLFYDEQPSKEDIRRLDACIEASIKIFYNEEKLKKSIFVTFDLKIAHKVVKDPKVKGVNVMRTKFDEAEELKKDGNASVNLAKVASQATGQTSLQADQKSQRDEPLNVKTHASAWSMWQIFAAIAISMVVIIMIAIIFYYYLGSVGSYSYKSSSLPVYEHESGLYITPVDRLASHLPTDAIKANDKHVVPHKIFISYSHKDKKFLDALNDAPRALHNGRMRLQSGPTSRSSQAQSGLTRSWPHWIVRRWHCCLLAQVFFGF